MRRRNKLVILATLVLLASSVAVGRYVYSQGFTKKWRTYITDEFEKRGVYLDFEKLTMDPVRGLVAREVTLFDGEKRETKLAKVDHISLDIDYAGLGERDLFLDSIELKDADLWFRLGADNAGSERLKINNFSARIFLTGDRIQISRAEGLVNGIEVSLRGLFFNGGKSDPGDGGDIVGTEDVGIGQPSGGEYTTREVLATVVRWLDKLKFDKASPPQLEIDIHGGNLEQPENLRGTFHFVGRDLEIGRYECKRVEAILETGRGAAVLKRFSVEDKSGRLDANAEYHYGDLGARFHLESEADLRGFLLGVLEVRPLAEIVFYDAPKVSLSGEVFLWPGERWSKIPLRAVGRVECGTVASRGKIFESGQADFSIDGDRFYLRNVVVEHRTGGFSGEAMQGEDGFRYRATLTLDPRVFEPFCSRQSTRELLRRFDFGTESSIFVELSGSGPDVEPANWENEAEIELRNFSYSGLGIRRFEGVLHLASALQEYKEVEVSTGEGKATAELVSVDPVNEVVEIRNLQGDVDIGDLLGCFGLEKADELPQFRFGDRPVFEVGGLLDLAGEERSDLKIGLRSERGLEWKRKGVAFPISGLDVSMHLLRNGVSASGVGALFGGQVEFEISRVGGGDWTGVTSFHGLDFGKSLAAYFPEAPTAGGQLGGLFAFSEASENGGSGLEYSGEIQIVDGNVFAIPTFRSLSDLIGDEPSGGWGNSGITNGSISLHEGVVRVGDFQAESAKFRIRADGEIDLRSGEVDLRAKAIRRGSSGGKIVEGREAAFSGKGKVGEVVWGAPESSGD